MLITDTVEKQSIVVPHIRTYKELCGKILITAWSSTAISSSNVVDAGGPDDPINLCPNFPDNFAYSLINTTNCTDKSTAAGGDASQP